MDLAKPAESRPKRTALYSVHKAAGARMMEFGGWDMPIEYAGITQEHLAVRQRADDVASVQAKVGKPVVLVAGPPVTPDGVTAFDAMNEAAALSGLAVFPTMRRASRAIARLLWRQRFLAER